MSKYQAFFDESGSHDSPVHCLAGWIATPKVWEELSQEWQAMLDCEPHLPYWHTTEAMHLRGAFRGWSRANMEKRLALALDIAIRHNILGYANLIFADDYKHVFGNRHKSEGWHFHRILVGTLISDLAKYLILKDRAHPFEITFDENQQHGAFISATWQYYVNAAPPEIRGLLPENVRFADDKSVIPLQVADLLSWHRRRVESSALSGKNDGLPWPSNSDPRIKFVQLVQTRRSLQSILDGARNMAELHGIRYSKPDES